eukprot:351853-Chlamydomonas_euryale.AAC.14
MYLHARGNHVPLFAPDRAADRSLRLRSFTPDVALASRTGPVQVGHTSAASCIERCWLTRRAAACAHLGLAEASPAAAAPGISCGGWAAAPSASAPAGLQSPDAPPPCRPCAS